MFWSEIMSVFDIFKKLDEQKAAAAAQPIEWLIVGLGNPGSKYDNTRHNAGFRALESYCARSGCKIDKMKFKALVGETTLGGARVLLMKPQTFMNLSGEAVRDAAAFYKIAPAHIIVLSDDVSLDVGTLRVRPKGSAGGQNGLKNIIYHLGSEEFPRVKIGVGKKLHPGLRSGGVGAEQVHRRRAEGHRQGLCGCGGRGRLHHCRGLSGGGAEIQRQAPMNGKKAACQAAFPLLVFRIYVAKKTGCVKTFA